MNNKIKSLKIQLTLNASIPEELELIEYFNKTGKRSGFPKFFMLNGFQTLIKKELKN